MLKMVDFVLKIADNEGKIMKHVFLSRRIVITVDTYIVCHNACFERLRF